MNAVCLIGRLVKDPEVRYISENTTAVATFTLAIDRFGSKEKKTDFPRITVFGKSAENCEKYLTKGNLVGVQGRLQTGSYQNKDGATVYTTDVVADRVEFLESKKREGTEHRESTNAPSGVPDGFQAIDDDDDVPF